MAMSATLAFVLAGFMLVRANANSSSLTGNTNGSTLVTMISVCSEAIAPITTSPEADTPVTTSSEALIPITAPILSSPTTTPTQTNCEVKGSVKLRAPGSSTDLHAIELKVGELFEIEFKPDQPNGPNGTSQCVLEGNFNTVEGDIPPGIRIDVRMFRDNNTKYLPENVTVDTTGTWEHFTAQFLCHEFERLQLNLTNEDEVGADNTRVNWPQINHDDFSLGLC